jgi:2'-5' RNA ligase
VAKGLTDREKFLRRIESLALSTLPTRELTAASEAEKHHDGVMVALVPEDPDAIAVDADGALPAEDLHVTLCYLGKVQDLSSFDKSKILADTRSVCDEVGTAFSTSTDGVIIMGQNDEGVPATALLVQSEEIVNLYDALADALNYQPKYPSFIPHMTTGYGVPAEVAEEKVGQPVNFNKIIVKFGDDIHVVPLSTAITAAPRSANVIDRVIDSLGRLWDEALHPRDGDGRFIKKNGAVSGKLAVPTRDRKSVTMVDANRASVVGFHTFGDEVWVLAEITDDDGTTSQGFARATTVRSVAPVKARLDALYPIDERGDAFINSSLERKRQLDLLLSYITTEYGPSSDEDGAREFIDSLGLWQKDLDYIHGGSDDTKHLGGIRRIYHELSDDEMDEAEDIIADARSAKTLRERVHGLKEDRDLGFSAEDSHVAPKQQLLQGATPDPEVIAALKSGADPLSIHTTNLLGAMGETARFKELVPKSETGISPISWLLDPSDKTEHDVGLAGTGTSTTDRTYFVKTSVIGAEFGNTDIVREVLASLIHDQIKESSGDDARLLPIPKAVFGDNPEWDGDDVQNKGAFYTHQPGHVVMQHASYLAPADWDTTDAFTETVALRNDIRNLDAVAQADQTAAHNEDMGNLYGNNVAKMVLWDFAILNGDRNPGNALLVSSPDGSDGRVLPIDHGFAFDDDPDAQGDAQTTFEWFTQYQLTQAWIEYVIGGLALNDRVSEASLRQVISDFSDVYGQIDGEEIIARFRAIPGVTAKQIEEVETWIAGLVDRISWIINNGDAVYNGITSRSKP